ncbi:apolipoprotein D-like [Mytilus edulis]|uniref:apolipoprotein D-like n=1 Tax=Mytilus edulis TaxID=6550 RepID=UPI0039EE29EA
MVDFNFICKLVCLLCVLVPIFGQVTRPGVCPNVRPQPGFDLNRFLGQWYESEKFFFIPEIGLRCNSALYTLTGNGAVSLVISGIETSTGMVRSVSGTGISASPIDPGRFVFQFSPVAPPEPYWVLDTDYEGYSVVYSCRQEGFQKIESAFILTRARTGLPAAIRIQLYSKLLASGINAFDLIPTDQTSCPAPSPFLPPPLAIPGVQIIPPAAEIFV